MKTYHDIDGDGGSDIAGQIAAQQDGTEAALAAVRHLVAVGSGKGGVGKSTTTLLLARALRARGRTVAILDADFNGPTQGWLAGLVGTPLLPGEHRMALPRTPDGIGVFSLGTLLPREQPLEFANVAEGAAYFWRSAREFALLGELLPAIDWGMLDYLLIDLPPGTDRTLQHAEYFGPRASIVLVTIPSDISREVVARTATALGSSPTRVLGYIENMAGYFCAACCAVKPLFPTGRDVPLGIPCLGTVPFDPEIALTGDEGRAPHVTDSPSLRSVAEIAARIERLLEDP